MLATLGTSRRIEQKADEEGLSGKHREEFLNREKRISFLKADQRTAHSAAQTTHSLLMRYEKALLQRADQSKQQIWSELLKEEYGTTEPVQGILPGLLSSKAPDKISHLIGLAKKEASLADYRAEISEALAQLPLDAEILAHGDHLIAKTVAPVEEKFNQALNSALVPIIPSSVEGRIDFNSVMMRKAKARIGATDTPKHIRRSLQDSVDFFEKYSLQPPPAFLEYVLGVESYLD